MQRGERRSIHEADGPIRTLEEVALLLYEDGTTDCVLPKNHVAMIEKRAMEKLRRNHELLEIACQMFGGVD